MDRKYMIYMINEFCEELGLERIEGLEIMTEEELQNEFDYYSDILDK
ncbi:hypothetical protein [Cetobacterium sp.]